MEYLDFSSVITTIRKYISEAHNINQIDLMYDLFVSFLSDESSMDFTFDNGLVCRWFNGQAKISPRITGYYMDRHQRNHLAADMHRNVLPLMYDSAMTVQDTTISDKATMIWQPTFVFWKMYFRTWINIVMIRVWKWF